LQIIPFFHKKDKNLSKALNNIFGFKPGNIFIYHLAFTHCSFSEEKKNILNNNERLEFLGDAIIGAVVAEFLFKKFPCRSEGFMTEMRSKIVNRTSLNKLSQKMGIEKLIQYQSDSNIPKSSVAGDALEAFIGALFLDKGYKFARKIIVNRIILRHIDIEELVKKEFNYKSRLLEWAHKEHKTIEFKAKVEMQKGANKYYIVNAIIDSVNEATGEDYSIKKAEQNAAEIAYNKLVLKILQLK